ncbi:MAG: O-antigen ligase family protein [Candidatus Kapabacteria bacterium]|nr:O-antigen ligase family protein [Candidatus Kapabacteria bacterium]
MPDASILPIVLLPALASAVGFVALLMSRPRLWLTMFMATVPFFASDTGHGLTASEAITGGVLLSSITLWFAWHIASNRGPLLRSWADFLLVSFIAVAVLNLGIALANDLELFGWAVDWSYFILMLYYFPLREEFGKDLPSMRSFVSIIGGISLIMSVQSAWNFKRRLAENLVYAYQIVASRSTLLGPFFLLAVCIAVVLAVSTEERRTKILAYGILMANLAALALTFTRTIWVFAVACIGLSMLFLRVRNNVRIIVSVGIIAIVAFIGAYLYNPRITGVIVAMVKTRFASSTQFSGGDHSFETRIIEVTDVLRKVKQAPLGGHGLRATFVTWAPIDQAHHITSYVHIGYVGLVHKVGLPTALLMFSVIIIFGYRSLRVAWLSRAPHVDPSVRALAVGTFVFYPAMLAVIFMSGMFDQRHGNALFAFMFASIAMCENFLVPSAQPPISDSRQGAL